MLNATVGECLNEFCDRINQPREAAYVTGTTPAARQYVSLLKKVGDDLLTYLEWTQLKRIYTFTTTLNVANYQLPGDFLRPLTGTQWGITNQIPLAGPLSNARLAFQTYGVNIATPFAGYQINSAQGYIFNTSPYTQKSAGYFQISPPGQDNTTQNVIAYTSCNYIWPINWVANTAYALGNIRTGVNNMYYCSQAGTSGTTRLTGTSGEITDGSCKWLPYSEPYTPATDNDFLLLDQQLFVEGMRWNWFEAKQQFQAAQAIKANWITLVSSALGKGNGVTAINAGYDVNSSYEWPVVAVGGWGPIPS